MKMLSIAFALVSFGLVACGGGGAEQGRTNPMSARSAVDSAAVVKTTLTGSSGGDYPWPIDGSLTLTETRTHGTMASTGHVPPFPTVYIFTYDYDVSTDF